MNACESTCGAEAVGVQRFACTEEAVGTQKEEAGAQKPAYAAEVLCVEGLSCGYGGRAVLQNVSFTLSAGQVLSLLGPNGVGKTTLFKTLLGFLAPLAGSVSVCGRGTAAWTRRDFARAVAYIPQQHTPSFAFSVRDVVLMGRTPHLDGLASPGKADEQVVDACLDRMGIAHLAQRDYSSLSGGERQMVLIARALAQESRILVMDEPCASLDFGNQARLLAQLAALGREGFSVVMTTHDPNHALLLDGDVLCLENGGVAAAGRARAVLTAGLLERLYGVRIQMGGACMPVLENEGGCSR